MKKNTRKLLTMACCALLLVCLTVGATYAYLTSEDSITNTFTVGNVAITLDEAAVNTDGTYVTDVTNRVETNEYHLLPGHSYIKDPTIHVDENSEDCWLYVKIENSLVDIEGGTTILDQMKANGWGAHTAEDFGTIEPNVYAYKEIVSAGAEIPVFGTFTVAGDVTNGKLNEYEGKTIVVTAYAIQADGFENDANGAWVAGFGVQPQPTSEVME